MKYLGIVLDTQLSFNEHLRQLKSKVSYKINILQQIRPFLNTETSRLFYIGYIRPLLEYCPVLLNSINKTQCIALEQLQNRALRIISHNPFHRDMTSLRRSINIPTLKTRRDT